MPSVIVPRSRAHSSTHYSKAEDVAVILALVLTGLLALVITAVIAVELLDLLPERIHIVVLASLVTFCAAIGWALWGKVLSLPRALRRKVPVVRFRRR